MKAYTVSDHREDREKQDDNRLHLIDGIPATERRINLAGIDTAVLEGGDGPPVILLHGPGETSLWWMRVITRLVKTHRLIVPDLPGHGASMVSADRLRPEVINAWLSELITRTSSSRPVLAGHLLGGAMAARFAIKQGNCLDRLVLVNSFGLGTFRPAPGFVLRLIHFLIRPTRKTYRRFLPQCVYDVDELRKQMGSYWKPFLAYNLECAQNPNQKAALRTLMRQLGIPRIPPEALEKIEPPVALIWGRHDRANRLEIAKTASERYGWPLHIIENARDDPKLEQPEVFVQTLHTIMNA
ncbi:alpha/beta fold hydrolase [Fodinibius sediminis]|uniref:Pimeloyl-ACP methyl ester carboxylesterase n=1 Tax=Fodinibius sediminis TaxID=1214077 RepID=A0A521AQM0_9BACT|nr:alpha/beta hydrolase [Fodinibius sediminis]SMO37085.1 Pimeloyl-ACP methyl ester carboxylesterase [Fodinibius sediminis]